MIVPDKVLEVPAHANAGLAQLYGMALRLDGFTVPEMSLDTMAGDGKEETIESAFARLEEVRPRIWALRDIMRTELGISPARNDSRSSP